MRDVLLVWSLEQHQLREERKETTRKTKKRKDQVAKAAAGNNKTPLKSKELNRMNFIAEFMQEVSRVDSSGARAGGLKRGSQVGRKFSSSSVCSLQEEEEEEEVQEEQQEEIAYRQGMHELLAVILLALTQKETPTEQIKV